MVPTWYVFTVTFLFGALMGSFLNVVGLRFLKSESIVWPGSHCPQCNTPLKPYDNIPMVSWLLLRGRCRTCQGPIHPQYPLVELLTALLFLATVHQYGLSLQTLLLLVLFCNLVVILITDCREHYIFDINSLGLIPFGLLYSFLNLGHLPGQKTFSVAGHLITLPDVFISALVAIAGSFILFYALNLFSKLMVGKPGFGEGDTRLLMGLGAYFGLKWMIMIFILGFMVQVALGLPLLVTQWIRQKNYAPVVLFALAFILAIGPYFAQLLLPSGTGLIVISLITAILALICTFAALQQARKVTSDLTYLPFGPALALGGGLMVFYNAPLLQFAAYWFHH